MKTKYILTASALIFALASCTSEVEEAVSSQPVPLQIQVKIENSSRAANVADTDFKEGESIGFFVNYLHKDGKSSVDYHVATFNEGKWIIDKEILFNGTAELRAFYPSDCGINDGKNSLYVDLNLKAGQNHMTSDVIKISEEAPLASIGLHHVMSRIRFEVTRPDAIPLSNIFLQGPQIYSQALYYFNGIITHEENGGGVEVNNLFPSYNKLQEVDVPVIAYTTGYFDGNAILTLNYEDGKSYRTELNFPKLEKGHYYIVPVTISKGEAGDDDPEAFTITTSILDWTEQEMNELEITNKNVVE